jgi:hypothetical protein
MRLYVSSRSYPELREVDAGFLRRGGIWLRAFGSAFRDRPFQYFVLVQLALILGGLAISGMITREMAARPFAPVMLVLLPLFGIGLQLPAMLFTVSVGGDVIRPHLRAVCPEAREACPSCGYGLQEQFEGAEGRGRPEVRCPECGVDVPVAIRHRPHRIPAAFRAVSWPRPSRPPGSPHAPGSPHPPHPPHPDDADP